MPSSRLSLLLGTLALAASGCGGAPAAMGGADMGPSGSATTYTPFSASNLAAQQVRVALFEELSALRASTAFDKTKCGDLAAPAAGTLAEIYTRNDAVAGVLRDKVKGRVDDHAYNPSAAIGAAMDQAIAQAITDCSAGTLAPKVAGQLVEKTLLGFFYASVYHELALGMKNDAESPEKWDEAFGYYGRSTDGATSRGLARLAATRDMDFNLTLNDSVFRGLIQGRAQVAAKDAAAIAATAEKIDRDLLLVLAYSTAHEFAEFAAESDPAEELAEGKALFAALEPYLKSKAPTEAAFVRAQLDQATYANAKAVDAAGIVSRLETVFGIDVTP